MFETLSPIFVLGALTLVTAIAMLYLPDLLARKDVSTRKLAPYECGLIPDTDAQQKFPIKFFLIAIDFVVFDVEIVFMYPWAIAYKDLGWYGFYVMGVFLILLILGFIYVVGKGGLRWE